MVVNVKKLVEAADAVIPKITPTQAREMMARGNALVVDVRDAPEVEKSGKIAGAVHAGLPFGPPKLCSVTIWWDRFCNPENCCIIPARCLVAL